MQCADDAEAIESAMRLVEDTASSFGAAPAS